MNKPSIIALLLAISALVAYLFGTELQSSNPDGVWLFSPPADGSGMPSDSFHTGFALGQFLMTLTYMALSATIYSWGMFKGDALPKLFAPLLTTTLISSGLTLIFAVLL